MSFTTVEGIRVNMSTCNQLELVIQSRILDTKGLQLVLENVVYDRSEEQNAANTSSNTDTTNLVLSKSTKCKKICSKVDTLQYKK